MVIIADSGSTKTDWALVEKQVIVKRVKTQGLNPVVADAELIIREMRKVEVDSGVNISAIRFDGAGC